MLDMSCCSPILHALHAHLLGFFGSSFRSLLASSKSESIFFCVRLILPVSETTRNLLLLESFHILTDLGHSLCRVLQGRFLRVLRRTGSILGLALNRLSEQSLKHLFFY